MKRSNLTLQNFLLAGFLLLGLTAGECSGTQGPGQADPNLTECTDAADCDAGQACQSGECVTPQVTSPNTNGTNPCAPTDGSCANVTVGGGMPGDCCQTNDQCRNDLNYTCNLGSCQCVGSPSGN